ncbi:pyruvate, phosphate dikinase [Ancylomarina sp. DW003]|nr:PEP/pyruvate-binding domain-containing protein [Ancylomarina sp. DW003]MDE5424276.1 pyruvate, phosphate dikinase [Ancylomarina sp. DW003]
MTSQSDKRNVSRLAKENIERLKELAAINKTTGIIKEAKSISDTLQHISFILKDAMQYPPYTSARITFDGRQYLSPSFIESEWVLNQTFDCIDKRIGLIEIFYTKEFPDLYEGPFLKEERDLINNISNIISGYINTEAGKNLITQTEEDYSDEAYIEGPFVRVENRNLLNDYLNRNNADRDVYHDLMPFKVKEILLVANLYDAYNIEREGRFTEQIFDEYHQLNLSSMPRVTGVSCYDEAMKQLRSKHFDMIIVMVGVDKKTPIELSERVKRDFPYISIFLLLNNDADIGFYEEQREHLHYIDKMFVWNGESQVFIAMIKSLEDRVNAENDTDVGLVRVILLVEDSAKYYSRYLPMLYQSVMAQTQRIIDDVTTDPQYKILRMRARPKVLLASNYEEALSIYSRYKDYLLCLISDVKYKMNEVMDEKAGIKLVEQIRSEMPNLPAILQSSEVSNSEFAEELKCSFIEKNSDSLRQDIRSFIEEYLGFGDFVYKNIHGDAIVTAKSLREFEEHLYNIPAESLIYHANRNNFSLWLMARGEVKIAKMIARYKTTDFKSAEDIRAYLISMIHEFRNEKRKGKIVAFKTQPGFNAENIVSLSSGSLGGKGRGLAFINSMLYNLNLSSYVPGINVKAPMTAVIGVDEYMNFIERNDLLEKIKTVSDYSAIQELFLKGSLRSRLKNRIRHILSNFDKPLAIRSSGLFEDSLQQPVAGIFQTYLLPNSNPDLNVRLNQVLDAIKLVYASVFSNESQTSIHGNNYSVDEERMGIVIQEVVGNTYENYFYPHISGVAQSYNYYPYGHMKPEDGFAVIAVGLGKYVVDGEKAYRFSPAFPASENNTPKDQFKNSQLEFYAINLKKKELNLLEGDTAGLIRLDIDDAEDHGTLTHCASVYDVENDIVSPGLDKYGPRIVNFANILKYDHIPLAKTIRTVLEIIEEAMGSAVEIEFSVDLNRDDDGKSSFYILQIKPLVAGADDYNIDLDSIVPEESLLISDKGMGNGLIEDIADVIFIDPDLFEKDMTPQIADKIAEINQRMHEEDKNYILVGPGRWGTRDKWIGIPVKWKDISRSKLIVETSYEDYPLEASSGSHFFHNVTSMNIGYCSVYHHSKESHIDYKTLKSQKLIEEDGAIKHVRFENPFTIKMDGKKRLVVVTK